MNTTLLNSTGHACLNHHVNVHAAGLGCSYLWGQRKELGHNSFQKLTENDNQYSNSQSAVICMLCSNLSQHSLNSDQDETDASTPIDCIATK